MREERYDKFLESTAIELFNNVHYQRTFIRTNFLMRHGGPLKLKAERRRMERTIKEYRQQCAALLALKKQVAQPVMYQDTARETKEYCLNCGEDFEGKEWHYNYCPSCGQRLEWSWEK